MRRFRDDEGAALVEFALSSVVLFMTMFGLMAVCTVLYSYVFVAEAAREASRYALVRGSACTGFSDCVITPAQVNTYVKGLSYPGINPGNLTATTTFTPDNKPGSVVAVTVSYNTTLNIPFWPKSGKALQLSSTSQMVISQ